MDGVEAEIMSLEIARARGLVENDLRSLAAMTAESYVHIEANGSERDKAAFLEALAEGNVRFSRYDLLERLVRVYGETAVVTGIFANEMVRRDGSRSSKTGRFCRVYARFDGNWRNVLHQATEIAPPPAVAEN